MKSNVKFGEISVDLVSPCLLTFSLVLIMSVGQGRIYTSFLIDRFGPPITWATTIAIPFSSPSS